MTHPSIAITGMKYMLAGSSVALAVGLLANPGGLPGVPAIAHRTDWCQPSTQPAAHLNREQLSRLLTVPERSSRTRVQQILQASACKLPDLQVRAGVTAEREAYPLAFDDQTWLVVLYEGNEYAGYSFSFRRQ